MCHSYNFKSKTEQKKHVRMFHRRAKSAYNESDFEYLVCKKEFTSLASLNRRKTKEGHNADKTAAVVGSSEQPKNQQRKTKQRTINKILCQHQIQVVLRMTLIAMKKRPALLPIVELIVSITLWLIGLVVNRVVDSTTQFASILLKNLKAN